MNRIFSISIVVGVLTLGIAVFGVSAVSAQVPSVSDAGITFLGGVQLIANSVGNLSDFDVFTVPAGVNLLVTDVIVSNSNASASCCARIFTGAGCLTERTGFITVPAGGSVTMNFLTGIGFASGQVVCVRNGDSAGPLHFTLRGYRFTIP
jgi:hypothetical protein